MDFVKCKDCERGRDGKYHDCTLGIRYESIENGRGCYAGIRMDGDNNEHKERRKK